jgi:hypothetical protein
VWQIQDNCRIESESLPILSLLLDRLCETIQLKVGLEDGQDQPGTDFEWYSYLDQEIAKSSPIFAFKVEIAAVQVGPVHIQNDNHL